MNGYVRFTATVRGHLAFQACQKAVATYSPQLLLREVCRNCCADVNRTLAFLFSCIKYFGTYRSWYS